MRLVLVFLLVAVCARPVDEAEFRRRALVFEKHWDPFIRRLFGCELEGPTTAETCRPALGQVDRREYERARNAAKKLFELRD
jgi:hypothetical protein